MSFRMFRGGLYIMGHIRGMRVPREAIHCIFNVLTEW